MKIKKLLPESREEILDFYLLVSEEKYLIQQFLNKAEEKLRTGKDDEFSKIFIDESEDNFWQEFQRAVTTINMLTTYKFIVVECHDLFTQKTSLDDELIKLIDSNPKKISVFFWKLEEENDKIDGRIKTTKKLINKDNLIELDAPSYSKLDDWIKEKFSQYDKNVGHELVKALEFLYDNKLEALNQEIEKIITLNYEKNIIKLEDCREILSKEGLLRDNDIFEMIDKWAGDNREEAIKIYRRLVKEKGNMLIITMIQRQLRLLLSVKELRKTYSSPKKVATELGEHPYSIKQCFKQEKNFSREELIDSLRGLLKANRRIVKGVYVNKEDPIEDFLLE